MLLAIDIGNSRVKWGWHDGTHWVSQGAARYSEFLERVGAYAGATPDTAIVCNVAAAGFAQGVRDAIVRKWPRVALRDFRSGPQVCELANHYADPTTLGADRLAAAVGARARVQKGAIVVAAFGTATTIDTVSPDNDFLGGVILPGINLMLRSLVRNTALLPQSQVAPSPIAVPDSTPDAIAEGVARAQMGAVHETLAIAAERFQGAQLVVTGGAAHVLEGHLPLSAMVADNLVLEGLVRIQEKFA